MTRDRAIAILCDLCPPHTVIYTILRSVSRTRRKHTLALYRFADSPAGKCMPYPLAGLVSRALELPLDENGALIVKAQTPDVGFEVVQRLSFLLHGMLSKQTGKPGESGIPCEIPVADRYRAGYSLIQVWL